MSKGNRKRKLQPAQTIQPDRPSPMQMGLIGFPSSVTLNEQHLHQHISGDLANTLQVVNQMAPDMREQAMDMARKEQQHRHEQEEKINSHIYTLKQEELAANKELQNKQLRYIFVTDLIAKIITFLFVGAFLAVLVVLAIAGNYEALGALACFAVLLGICVKAFVWLMGKNNSAK